MRLLLFYFIVLTILSCSKQDKELGYKYDCDKLNGVQKNSYMSLLLFLKIIIV